MSARAEEIERVIRDKYQPERPGKWSDTIIPDNAAWVAELILALPPEGGEEKDEGRDMSGETFLGMRVAAWREEGRCGGKYGHVYSEHWSTPGAGAKNVERLFTEHQIQSTLAARNARIINLVGAIDDFAAALAAREAEIAALKADKARMGEALERLGSATPNSTHSATAHDMMSWMHAVALTALDSYSALKGPS